MSLCNTVRAQLGTENYIGTAVCVRDKTINIFPTYTVFSKGKSCATNLLITKTYQEVSPKIQLKTHF